MSETENGRLDLYGAEHWKCNHMVTLGFKGLNVHYHFRHFDNLRSYATAEIARDADEVDFKHSRSLKVIRCCARQRGICDFLLALNSNITFIFNRS